MAVGQPALAKLSAQFYAERFGFACAGQALLQLVEQGALLLGRQSRIVGDIVAGAHEIIESEYDRTQRRGDQDRRHRKILVAAALAAAKAFRRGDGFFRDRRAHDLST